MSRVMNTIAEQQRRRWSAVALIATPLVLLAGCGGSPSTTSANTPLAGDSTGPPSAVAYSACMRAHGVPNYPDPDSSGQLPKTDAQRLGVSTSRYQSAQRACQHVLPSGVSIQQQEHQCMENSNCSPAMVQQMLAADQRLARCMRSHGVPNFPDPTTDSHGPVFNITAAGISDAASHSRQFLAALNECGRLVRDNAPESFE
jgi:hypothetical protein